MPYSEEDKYFSIPDLFYFIPMLDFHTPRKRQKSFGFLTFSGCIEIENAAEMG